MMPWCLLPALTRSRTHARTHSFTVMFRTQDEAFWSGVHKAGDTVTLGPLRKAYEAVIEAGLALPVGVQVMGKPMNEELVLRAMAILESKSVFADMPFTFAPASP